MSISASPIQDKAFDTWTSGSTLTVTLASTPIDGNTLVVTFQSTSTLTAQVSSISQTGATWARVVQSRVNRNVELWYAPGVVGASTSVTINLNLTPSIAGTQSAAINEWSGIDVVNPLDQSNGSNGTSTTPTTANLNFNGHRESLVIANLRSGSAITAGPANGFTALTAGGGRDLPGYLITIPGTTGNVSTNWTQTIASYDTVIASFNGMVRAGNLLMMGV